ncbi:MAG: DivIVA domain-containing protein [Oscillospiraceae bacterium]|nr:DivIVA domain-containing protein [Oscillospiraceae bacterium]
MLTPQEVSERAFAKASFGGYNMAMVDEFLDILTADYTALYNENAVLKSKMKVLVDKVEEYRATEEAMRKALMSAQRMADQLVQEAQEKKQAILWEAEQEAANQTAAIRQQTELEQARLVAAQQATATYVQQVRQLQEKAQEILEHLDEITPATQPAAAITREEEAAQEIEDSVQRILEAQLSVVRQELEEEPEEPTTDLDLEQTTDFALDREPGLFDEPEDVDEQEADEDMDRTRVIHRDFGPLEFGRDYEIK